MPKKPKPHPLDACERFAPFPSEGGVGRIRALYRERTRKEITEDEARDALPRITRFQYLNFLVNTEHEERAQKGAEAVRRNPRV